MASSPNSSRRRIVVDSIHGDIELDEIEWQVVDTASFQRLRHIKQLGMGHLVYPNATHTRFAHSLGVLGIMHRILATAERNGIPGVTERKADLRLAALLHDVGHYPYSHLLEGVDRVQLAEEFIHDPGRKRGTIASVPRYPKHESLSRIVLTEQKDLLDAIGGPERAKKVADLFTGTAVADKQWSKLISSSLDMDRLDYLLRDARAAGVPYGAIDLNYLLTSLQISSDGLIGVDEKAMTAAEQYLFARYFMHRAVYWHKTTYAFEEAARQLIRRIRDAEAAKYGLPSDGTAVTAIMKGATLRSFNDAFLDTLIARAAVDSAIEAIKTTAQSLLDRRPAKLLREVCDMQRDDSFGARATAFKKDCKHKLSDLARDSKLPLWRFMYCETLPLRLEKRGPDIRAADAGSEPPEEADELIRVFPRGETDHPKPLVDLEHSLINAIKGARVRILRLYVIDAGDLDDARCEELRDTVRGWDAD